MRIAMVCTEKLPIPPIAGGAVQLYIHGALPYLSEHHQITVFGIQYPGLPDEEEIDSVKYIRVPAKDANEYVKNLKQRLTGDFDLIHIFNRPLWVLQLSAKLPDVKFSLSLHNEMFHPEKINDQQALDCVNRVEFINTVSQFIADGVKKRVPSAAEKLNVVYSGANIEEYKPVYTTQAKANKKKLKEKYKLKGYRVILFVGRLSEKKGVHILMKAMKKVMELHRNTALVIVGSKWFGENKTDDYTRTLQNLSRELTGPIVFTGFVPPSEIPSLYNLADIFVCPSQWEEPLARVHYEAMAAGLPIITTNRGGNAEVVSGLDNGVVIQEYNRPVILSQAILHYLENPDLAQIAGVNGRKLAEKKFNWQRVAQEMFKTLEIKPVKEAPSEIQPIEEAPPEIKQGEEVPPETREKGGTQNENINPGNRIRRIGFRNMFGKPRL